MILLQKKHIFLSSSVKNFRYLRQIISDHIEKCGHIVYTCELDEFPVEGSYHPMDESLKIIGEKTSHFVLLLGKRWGLPYYENKLVSVTEMEFFKAKKEKLPILCFIEKDTWIEASKFHKEKKSLLMRILLWIIGNRRFDTDLKVLKFIDEYLMHEEISWITPFSHYNEILKKLSSSWLIWTSEPKKLFFVEKNEEKYFNAIDNYVSAFVSYILDQTELPVPSMEIPQHDQEYIAIHRAFARKVNAGPQFIDPFDDWIKVFETLREKINIALQSSYRSICEARRKDEVCFGRHYPSELKEVLRRALENYLGFARMEWYGEAAIGKVPQMKGYVLSETWGPIEQSIHEKFNTDEHNILGLEIGRGHDRYFIGAYIPRSIFKKWQECVISEYFSDYNKFLKDWAAIVIPQTIAFSYELTEEQFEQIISLNFSDLMGVGTWHPTEGRELYLSLERWIDE